MNEPDRGRIIWTDVIDRRGKPVGEHACVIITRKADLVAGKPIKAVVVSSNLRLSVREDMVQLPAAPGGHPQTGFHKKCAAICDWEVEVKVDEIRKFGSLIWGPLLEDILKKVAAARSRKKLS